MATTPLVGFVADVLKAFSFVVQLVSASLSVNTIEHNRSWIELSPILSVGMSVRRSVRKVYCGKTADCVRIPFGVVSGVGQLMGVLDEGGDIRR